VNQAGIVRERWREFCEVVSRFNGLQRARTENFRFCDAGVRGLNMFTRCIALAAASVVLCNASFAQAPPAPAPLPVVAPAGSLYARLGGTPVVSALVSETIEKVAAAESTKRSFDKVNLQHVKDMLAEQICSLTGGGCTYTGDTMRDVHAGHQITNAEFFELVEVLRVAMRQHGVPLAARNELLEILAPMKRDVVKL
jgi:hemoglobin